MCHSVPTTAHRDRTAIEQVAAEAEALGAAALPFMADVSDPDAMAAMAAAGDDQLLDAPTPTAFDRSDWEWR